MLKQRLRHLPLCLYFAVMPFSSSVFGESTEEIISVKQELLELQKRLEKLETAAQNPAVLQEQVDELELTVDDVVEQVGDRPVVNVFDGIKLDIGGFLHSAYTYADGEDGSVGSFNRQNFELLIGAELTEEWSAFIAAGFLREANDPFSIGSRTDPVFDTNNRNPLIIGWVNYEYSDALNIRAGRMITPHGVINIEHFPATLLEPEQPQLLRPFGGNTIFPNFSTGVQAHGKFFQDNASISYAFYVTNATGANVVSNSEEIIGGRIAYGSNSGGWEIGLNFSDSYRGSTSSDNTLAGTDFHWRDGAFELKAEYYLTDEDVGGDREAYYIQPIYHSNNKWSFFYRYDFLDSGDVTGEGEENLVGVNFIPNNNVRLRITYTQKEFVGGFTGTDLLTPLNDADADIWQVSGTFSF